MVIKPEINKHEKINIRIDRLSLLIGTIIGQISELLNQIKSGKNDVDDIYKSLRDIHNAAGLQIHALYYKGKKRED